MKELRRTKRKKVHSDKSQTKRYQKCKRAHKFSILLFGIAESLVPGSHSLAVLSPWSMDGATIDIAVILPVRQLL